MNKTMRRQAKALIVAGKWLGKGAHAQRKLRAVELHSGWWLLSSFLRQLNIELVFGSYSGVVSLLKQETQHGFLLVSF